MREATPALTDEDLDRRLLEAIEQVLEGELAQRREELAAIAPECLELVDDLRQFLHGGKLLRPRFCFYGGLTALEALPDEAQVRRLARLGAAIELVQAAALMHDDVIDHSPVRRGRPAMHVRAAQAHRGSGLQGDAEEHGAAIAIILGDLALTWAEQMAEPAFETDAASARARAEFAHLRTEVMCGQYLDVLHQAGGFTSPASEEAAASAVIRWKTVPYTVLRPVRMGAALMGADDTLLAALGAWAEDVGTAFQLRDDLLSVIADEAETGKPAAGDILEGKRTCLLARTRERADARGRELLDRTVGNAEATAAEVAEVQRLMVSTGAAASVIADVRALAADAEQRLTRLRAPGTAGRSGLAAISSRALEIADPRS